MAHPAAAGLCCWLLIAAAALGQSASDFDDTIRPLFTQRCLQCHGPETKISDFDISTRDSLLRGGKNGAAVVPGKPEESRLHQWVAAARMPPDGKLAPREVEAIRGWIASGAPWGSEQSIHVARKRAGPDWWALQSVKKPPVPTIEGANNPIDAFLLAKLREKGLDYAPPADSRTLARRIHFDLTGLPPTPDRMEEPYERAVERLLASPQYGERWARHWLDVVRFGETDGGEHNHERFTAWKYRDYVIDAFNTDKPYDRFVREQIAGDVMDAADPKLVAATGFLVAGPWDSVTKKINRDEMMRKLLRQDELDDMVTATFATFQGLTVNCARCHDHKFDPIPTRDYYRLTAVFAGAGFGEREIATEEQRAARRSAAAPIEKRLAEVRRELGEIEDPVRTRMLTQRYQAFEEQRAGETRRIPVNPVWNRNRFDPVKAQHFRFVVTSHSGKLPKLDRLELLPAGHTAENWKGEAEATPDKPAYLTVSFEEPKAVAEIRWSADARSGSSDGAPRVYQFEYSLDGQIWTPACSSLDHVAGIELELPEVAEEELVAALSAENRERRKLLLDRRNALQQSLDALPGIERIYGVIPEAVTPSHVLVRGSLTSPGEAVTPGALTAIRQLETDIQGAADSGATRLALANWIASPRNPLTARVIVNRVWQYHFGSGIVNTPSDFGFNGDRPSHPELLDWLAAGFMENGWSLKWLHRLILHSRAYRQSSALLARAHEIDAANRLLWHMPLKRMDAETLRDSILFVAGNLRSDVGGPSFLLQKKAGGGSFMYKRLDNDGPEVWRRAVYRFVVRGGERVFLDSFDCPDPAVATPERSVSNTPVQALTLLNNRFLMRHAGLLAQRLEREAGPGNPDRITRAYNLLFGRAPSEKELSLGMRFLAEQSLTLYCRALLNSNEFVYVP